MKTALTSMKLTDARPGGPSSPLGIFACTPLTTPSGAGFFRRLFLMDSRSVISPGYLCMHSGIDPSRGRVQSTGAERTEANGCLPSGTSISPGFPMHCGTNTRKRRVPCNGSASEVDLYCFCPRGQRDYVYAKLATDICSNGDFSDGTRVPKVSPSLCSATIGAESDYCGARNTCADDERTNATHVPRASPTLCHFDRFRMLQC